MGFNLLHQVDLAGHGRKPAFGIDAETLLDIVRKFGQGGILHGGNLGNRGALHLLLVSVGAQLIGKHQEVFQERGLLGEDLHEFPAHPRGEAVVGKGIVQHRPFLAHALLGLDKVVVGGERPHGSGIRGGAGDLGDGAQKLFYYPGVKGNGLRAGDGQGVRLLTDGGDFFRVGKGFPQIFRQGGIVLVGHGVPEVLLERRDAGVGFAPLGRQPVAELLPLAAQETRGHPPLLLGLVGDLGDQPGHDGKFLDCFRLGDGPVALHPIGDQNHSQKKDRDGNQQPHLVFDGELFDEIHGRGILLAWCTVPLNLRTVACPPKSRLDLSQD